MSRLTRNGTAELVSRDQILRHERGQGNIHFPCSADHVQDRQPYPVDPYSCDMCYHTLLYCVTVLYYIIIGREFVQGTAVDTLQVTVYMNKPGTEYRYFQHAHFIPLVNVGKKAQMNGSMVTCQGSTRSELLLRFNSVPADTRQSTPSVRNCVTR